MKMTVLLRESLSGLGLREDRLASEVSRLVDSSPVVVVAERRGFFRPLQDLFSELNFFIRYLYEIVWIQNELILIRSGIFETIICDFPQFC